MPDCRVWVLAFPGSEMLDICGPWSVLSHANEQLGRSAYALQLVTMGGRKLDPRHGPPLTGGQLLPAAARAGLPQLLLVAGGAPRSPLPAAEARAACWLRRHHAAIPRIASICTGAFVLGAAGLLDGRRATTHFRWTALLRELYPRARVLDDGIYQRDQRIWTSAGITAGIDLTLALVERDQGRPVAMAVAKTLLLFLRRSGHQAQFSKALEQQHSEPEELSGLSSFVLEHVAQPLPVERLAAHLGMSARSLARRCRAELGVSPAAFVRGLRVERAKQLLEDTRLPLKTVALRTGFGDPSTLWRSFTRQLGVTPAEYRERFAAPPARPHRQSRSA